MVQRSLARPARKHWRLKRKCFNVVTPIACCEPGFLTISLELRALKVEEVATPPCLCPTARKRCRPVEIRAERYLEDPARSGQGEATECERLRGEMTQ